MADDTRQPEQPPSDAPQEEEIRRPRRRKSKYEVPRTQAEKMWEAFGNPDEPVNMIPGGQYNSAGGKPPEVTWRDAFKFKKRDYFSTKFAKVPCARDALMVGLGAGGAVGGVRFIATGIRSLGKSANWAVAAFSLGSLGQYTWCEKNRKIEMQGIMAAMIGMKKLHEKQQREKEAAEAAEKEAAKLAEEERLRNKRWYKFW